MSSQQDGQRVSAAKRMHREWYAATVAGNSKLKNHKGKEGRPEKGGISKKRCNSKEEGGSSQRYRRALTSPGEVICSRGLDLIPEGEDDVQRKRR